MTEADIDAWIGDAPATHRQRADLLSAAHVIEKRYPGEAADVADERTAALTGAARVILDGEDAAELVGEWRAAQEAAMAAHAAMTGAIIAAPGTDSEVHRRLGLTRVAVRKARAR